VAYAAAFGQARTLYIQILLLGVLFSFFYRRILLQWIAILLVGCLLIVAVTATGIHLKGRIGQEVSLNFMAEHLASASGTGKAGTLDSAAGVGQRLRWWSNIRREMEQSAQNEAFGLGFGMALTDFRGNAGKLTREPHNSYISVWARLGLAGIIAWAWMQIELFRSWWRSYRIARRCGWADAQNLLFLFMVFFFFILIAGLGEDAFEKPYSAIPYYLFFGVVLRYGMLLRENSEMRR
jgi:hypothetical protein